MNWHFAYHFQPGDTKSVTLVQIGGKQIIRGGNAIADGAVDDTNIIAAMEAVHARGFGHSEENNAWYTNLVEPTVPLFIYFFPFLFEVTQKLGLHRSSTTAFAYMVMHEEDPLFEY